MVQGNVTPIVRGIIAAVPTPFTPEEEVDLDGLRGIVRFLIGNGVHGLWVLGGGGEFPALNDDQRRDILNTVVEEAGGRVPVLAGTGASGTALATHAARLAAECGVDALFATAPFYYIYDDQEILAHMLAVHDATPLPIIVYHNPFHSKIRLPVSSIELLCQRQRIIAIKDSSLDFDYLQALLRAVPRDGSFQILQGNEMSLAVALLAGVDGAVLAAPTIAPRLCLNLYDAARAADVERAMALQAELASLFSVFNLPGRTGDSAFIAGQKGALELLGLCSRRVSRPFISLSEVEIQVVRQILERHHLLPSLDAPLEE